MLSKRNLQQALASAAVFPAALAVAMTLGCSNSVETSQLRLELEAKTRVIKPGEDPQFSVHLINEGSESESVVLPGDGSASGMRTPIVRWRPALPSRRFCGNINSLKADEVVVLSPGQRLLLSDWIGRPNLNSAGTYQVSIELENIPNLEWQGIPLGEHDAAAMEKVRQSPGFRAVSNVVEIKVQE